MKTLLYLPLAFLLLCSNFAFCDLIDPNSHHVNKCVKITNADDFDDLMALGYIDGVMLDQQLYEILPSNCLSKGYRFNSFFVYGISRQYANMVGIDSIDVENCRFLCPANIEIDPEGGTLPNSNPTESVNEYYRIMGFTEMNMVLHKYKKVIKYNNGDPDLIETYKYEGDSTVLFKSIQVDVEMQKMENLIRVFPNPADNEVFIKTNGEIKENIQVRIVTLTGKELLKKDYSTINNEKMISLSVADFPKGIYLLEVNFGNKGYTQKIIVE